eukprot:4238734-Pleurochrysis_carterae.AAC.7
MLHRAIKPTHPKELTERNEALPRDAVPDEEYVASPEFVAHRSSCWHATQEPSRGWVVMRADAEMKNANPCATQSGLRPWFVASGFPCQSGSNMLFCVTYSLGAQMQLIVGRAGNCMRVS